MLPTITFFKILLLLLHWALVAVLQLSLVVVHRLLMVVASLVAEHRL